MLQLNKIENALHAHTLSILFSIENHYAYLGRARERRVRRYFTRSESHIHVHVICLGRYVVYVNFRYIALLDADYVSLLCLLIEYTWKKWHFEIWLLSYKNIYHIGFVLHQFCARKLHIEPHSSFDVNKQRSFVCLLNSVNFLHYKFLFFLQFDNAVRKFIFDFHLSTHISTDQELQFAQFYNVTHIWIPSVKLLFTYDMTLLAPGIYR